MARLRNALKSVKSRLSKSTVQSLVDCAVKTMDLSRSKRATRTEIVNGSLERVIKRLKNFVKNETISMKIALKHATHASILLLTYRWISSMF